jgi:uncharacterized coiled-coil protein SlyX
MPVLEIAESPRIAELERQSRAQSARIEELVRQVQAFEQTTQTLSTIFREIRAEFSELRTRQNRLEALVSPPSPPPAATPHLASQIISDFPSIFSEFRGKRFDLLWRGTRDGFNASEFHRRCDGRGNTVTIIEAIGGFIFGGFTPIAWDSGGGYRADPGLRSFLFTLKNPWGVVARKFSLSDSQYAIFCCASYGPTFGGGHALHVANNSDGNTGSYTSLGYAYVNDTGREGDKFFTGARHFRAREVEVFQISG